VASLPRLFQREMESGNHLGSSSDAALSAADNGRSAAVDPWRVVVELAQRSKEGLKTTLQWLCLFATSGVDIPVSTFMLFSSSADLFDICLTDSLPLVEAALRATWLKSMGRQQLQAMFSSLHSRLSFEVLHCLQTKSGISDV
jgi:hypothetical protein